LRIRDDGNGIPAELLNGRPGHYGLAGMRERAKQVGGKLEIWSEAKAGTRIEFSVASSVAYANSPEPRFRVFRKK
jgi:signal transduction histidine kinase